MAGNGRPYSLMRTFASIMAVSLAKLIVPPVLAAGRVRPKLARRVPKRSVPRFMKVAKAAARLTLQVDRAFRDMDAAEITMATWCLALFTATFSPINPCYWLLQLYAIRVAGLWSRKVWSQCVVGSPAEPAATFVLTSYVALLTRMYAAVFAFVQSCVKYCSRSQA